MSFEIKTESPTNGPAIEALLDQAFGPDRENKTSYRYRTAAGPIPSLCRLAVEGGQIIGSIRYWPISIEPGGRPALLLGPLAVDDDHRAMGIGKALVDDTLAKASELGHRIVFLVGDPVFYRRFGFVPAPADLTMPGESSARLMVRLLGNGGTIEAGTLCAIGPAD
ncbi:MAG: N-acetyltransferase [Pseudomonadota bacterium]